MKLLLNGQLSDSKAAVISALDHGFLYGMGLFETLRTYGGGRPWLLEAHAARLSAGCGLLGIGYRPDPERLSGDIKRLLEANGLRDGYVRWSVSAGEGAIGLPSGAYERPNEILYVKELVSDTPATRSGKTLRLLRLPRSTPEGAVRLKAFHYMNNILAKRELAAAGAGADTEGLFLDGNGRVVEGMVSNVFWFKDGELRTPALETGPLAGITRDYVIGLAGKMEWNVPVREGLYGWEDLLAADEVFLTNSIQEIVPVVRLYADATGWRTVGRETAAGPLASRLMRRYREDAERMAEA